MTTAKKLWLGFGALTALLALFGVLMLVRLHSIERHVQLEVDVARPRAEAARRLELNVRGYVLSVRAQLGGIAQGKAEAASAAAEIENQLERYARLAETPRQRQLAKQFAEQWFELEGLGQSLMDAARATPPQQQQLFRLRNQLETFLDEEMQRDAVESDDARKEAVFRDLRTLLSFLLVLTAGCVAIALLTSVAVGRSVLRTEDALRERTDRYELVAAGAGDAIWDWDVPNHRVYFSPRWKELRGFAPDEIGDREEEWSSRIHPEDRSRVLAAVQAHIDGTTAFFAEEYRTRCKDGSWKWILDRGIARRDFAGRTIRMAGSESDITERKQAEQALSESERFARSTLDGLSAHIAIVDDRGTILAVNQPWRAFAAANRPADRMVSGSVEVGANYLRICDSTAGDCPEGGAAAAGIRAVLAKTLPEFTMEYPCHSPQEERWFLMRVTPFPGDGPRRAVVAHEDITKRKELEREVVEIASLEQRRIGQDLHDTVGQELTALNIIADNLPNLVRGDAPGATMLIGRITRGLRQVQSELRTVIRGLLPVDLDHEGLMAALADLADRVQQEGNVACAFNCPGPVLVEDNLAATQLFLIAKEAVHNALKHASARNIEITLQSDRLLVLRVRDDGIGLADGATAGKGLGLRIMRHRAGVIGAKLTIESVKPHGVAVTCTLGKEPTDDTQENQ